MRHVIALLLVVGIAALGCTSTDETVVDPVTAGAEVYVVLGAGQSDGSGLDDDLRGLWARRLLQDLPRRTVYVNLARPGATVASALVDQAPDAAALEPELVTVWLTSADAVAGTPLSAYRRDLTTLASSFGDRTEVLLLSGWDGADPAVDAPYIEEVRAVADSTAAFLVDVSDVDAQGPTAQQQVAERVLDVHRSR